MVCESTNRLEQPYAELLDPTALQDLTLSSGSHFIAMQGNPLDAHNPGPSSKVAIPRLNRAPVPPPPQPRLAHRKDRVRRACKSCRKRKIKCSGDVPSCKNCQFTESTCEYENSRHDRLRDAKDLNQTLASLLIDLSERVNDEDRTKINDVLQNAEDGMILQVMETSRRRPERWAEFVNEENQTNSKDGEARVGGATGSNEGLDYLDEDLTKTRETRETGYVGHNSEVQWLRSVQRQTEHNGAEPHFLPYGPPGSGPDAVRARSDALQQRRFHAKENLRAGSTRHTMDASFYLDSSNIDVDIVVDPYEVPDPETAEKLFDCYLGTVHSSFPLVSASFEENFRRYIESLRRHRPFEIPDKWRAHMNILLAIGAKYSHLIRADWRGDQRDHLIYMTRAVHLLGLKNSIMVISGPDMELVRAIGALSFYFLTIGHVSRAWIMIGLSIRLAIALGLHLRNEDATLNESRRDTRVHAWWSLYAIECLLSTITGRPPSVAFEYCTVPLPYHSQVEHTSSTATSEEASYRHNDDNPSPTSGSSDAFESKNISITEHHHISRINLSLISQRTLLQLYSPQTATQSWESTQTKISELLNDLEEWRRVEHPEVQMGNLQYNTKYQREQFLLNIDYWSKKILITRPCLCRLERRIRDQSDTSANFDTKAAEACYTAALEIAKLCPDQPNIEFIYSNCPWWAMVHILMQSTAVLLLEMTYNAQDVKSSGPSLIPAIKKMIRWLRVMQINDLVADRAYGIIWRILKSCAPSLHAEASDLLSSAEEGLSEAYISQHTPELFTAQTTDDWQQKDGLHNPITSSVTLDHEPFQLQPFGTMSEYQSEAFAYPSAHQNMSALPFSNFFFTRFDQVTPIANMEDLLAASGRSAGFETDIWNSSVAQSQAEPSQDPEQRQHEYHDWTRTTQ